MNTLSFQEAVRRGGSNRTERHYLDFIISGKSLSKLLHFKTHDYVTLLGWGDNKEYNNHILKIFTLQEVPDLKSGRVMLYVCPDCGDIDCGAITAKIIESDSVIVWEDFVLETDYDGVSKEYSEIEPIQFDKQNYLEAFFKLP